MNNNTNDPSKMIAAQIADMLASPSPDRMAILDMLVKMGYNQNEKPASSGYEDDFDFEGNIGIYHAVSKNGQTYYERDPRCKERWSYYADVQVIPSKSAKKRLVLLGESVARGFLLDPDFTPAHMLQSLLGVNSAAHDYEVIDLAETNLGMAGLKRRFNQCLALQPDIIVFLAGNNWRTDLQVYIDNDRNIYEQLYKAIAEKGGLDGVKPVVEEIFDKLVTAFIDEVGKTAAAHNIPLLFAIPEFNLGDCKSTPGEQFVSYLPGRRMQHWMEARDKAKDALNAGDWKALEDFSGKMIGEDITHPLGYEFMAQSAIRQGMNDKARQNLELARDTALFCRTNSKPRIFEIIKTVMRREFPKAGIHSIDIGDVFKNYLGGQVPDRRLFLDYCHYSVEGIQVAMDAVAGKVLEIVSGPGTVSTINPRTVAPDKDAYAYSHLFATIHNAHWGQPYPILEYHAAKALSYSRDIARIMIYYCEMMSRGASNNLCKSFELLIKDKRLDKYVHTMIHPRNQKTMELSLVDAMVAAMKNAGIQMDSVVRDLRIKEHGVQSQKLDLLNPFYHSTSYDEYQGTKTAFFQSRDNISRFFLAATSNTTVALQITLRIQDIAYDNNIVTLTAGDSFKIELDASSSWKNYTVVIPGKHIRAGINFIDIVWPSRFDIAENKKVNTLGKFGDPGQFLLDASFFVFGEINKFSAEPLGAESITVSAGRITERETTLV